MVYCRLCPKHSLKRLSRISKDLRNRAQKIPQKEFRASSFLSLLTSSLLTSKLPLHMKRLPIWSQNNFGSVIPPPKLPYQKWSGNSKVQFGNHFVCNGSEDFWCFESSQQLLQCNFLKRIYLGEGGYMRETGAICQIGVLTWKPCTFWVQNGLIFGLFALRFQWLWPKSWFS